jgi:hypothetical protein
MPILFTDENPDFYVLSQIYDPDTNPGGMIIPRPNSIVLDPDEDNLLQKVVAVDEATKKVSYEPVKTSLLMPDVDSTTEEDGASIVYYGNSRFYLFYDTREVPTKLTIDKKLIILGNDAETYSVMKKDSNGDMVPISLYYDENNVYQGQFIPLIEVPGQTNVKSCPSCHTSMLIGDDEVYYIHVFDYAGTLTSVIKVYGRKALVNNTLGDNEIIEGFDVDATQESGDDFYLYPEQDVDSLMMVAKLVYNTGREISAPIDGNICYQYGLENFIPSYPGQTAKVLTKYFLGEFQQAFGNFIGSSNGVRFLLNTKTIRVLTPDDTDYLFKISVIPYYVSSQSKYMLMFMLYEIGSTPKIVTSNITLANDFDGISMGVDQLLEMSFDLKDIHPSLENPRIVHQNMLIKIAPYNMYERYILRDPGDNENVFGTDSPITPRPVIYYDSNIQKYFIPTSRFNNKNLVLEAFYYRAKPLFDTNLSAVPVEPTHFTIRDVLTGNELLTSPISLDDYTQSWAISGLPPESLTNRNCIVEFLKESGGAFDYLYGTPVDVYPGTFNQ